MNKDSVFEYCKMEVGILRCYKLRNRFMEELKPLKIFTIFNSLK